MTLGPSLAGTVPVGPDHVWQHLYPPGTLPAGVQPGGGTYAAALPDGRQVLLPVRVLPGGDHAVASLIVNQAAFAVLDALADALTAALRPHAPGLVIGVPTLGLTLAEGVARRLGHARMVPLGTSVKFWYDESLSEPLNSLTTPDQAKRLYIDPRMMPLLAGARVAVVDDVLSTGSSIAAVLRLLARAGVAPVVIGAAMLQGQAWRTRVAELAPGCPVVGAIATPVFSQGPQGWAG